MNIVCVASEGVPFAKTGGLADVAWSSPRALLQRRGVHATVRANYSSCSGLASAIRRGRIGAVAVRVRSS